jgi:pSer/pThr/pTyr-binding forkhead associated (FHA) protein
MTSDVMTLASEWEDGVVSADVTAFPGAGVAWLSAPRFSSQDRRAPRTLMPVIKVNDQQFSLRPGPNRLGAGADADVSVVENASLGVQAIVEVRTNAHAVIHRVNRPNVVVRVNGVPLVEPTPLIHGDKVEIAGHEMFFADDSKVGVTQHISAAEVAAAAKRPGSARATASTGGRVVSLVDGKEYKVVDDGLTIGRDAACDVVVAQNDVSRKHAEIRPGATGYELRDLSANGVFVNGVRIENLQVLSRADVIRIGTEDFRFYADVLPPIVPASRQAASLSTLPPTLDASVGSALIEASADDTAADRVDAPVPASDDRPILAFLDVTSDGPAKGAKYEIRVPFANVGRGAHNDIVLPDDSVSDVHARFQRRDDRWYLVDVGSRNGTYVGGQRLSDERRIEGAQNVRFGGVKTIFRPRDGAVVPDPQTTLERSKASGLPDDGSAKPAPQVTTALPPNDPATSRRGLSMWFWSVVVLAVGAAVVFFLLNR